MSSSTFVDPGTPDPQTLLAPYQSYNQWILELNNYYIWLGFISLIFGVGLYYAFGNHSILWKVTLFDCLMLTVALWSNGASDWWWVSSPWTEAPKGFHAAGFFFFVPLAVTEYCVVLQPYLRVRVVKPEIKKYGSDIFMGLYAIFCFVFGVLSSEIVWKAYIEGRGDDGDAADAWISPPKFFLMFFFDAVICVLMHWAAKDHLSNEFVSEEVAETLNYLSWSSTVRTSFMGMINLLTFCFWFNRKYSPPGIYNGVYFPYSDAIGVLNYFKQCFSLFSLLDLSILEIQKLKRKADKKAITSNTRGTESVAISTRVMADSTV